MTDKNKKVEETHMAKVNVEKDFIYDKIMDVREYNPSYHADGTLVWKKIGGKTGRKGKRKKKIYPSIGIEKITISDECKINESVLEASRKQYEESGEMIPVFLSYGLKLLQGYEQYVLAKELGLKRVPFQKKQMTKKEQREFSHGTSDRKIGNKKYPITTIDGKREWMSQSQNKKVRSCHAQCRRLGNLSLKYLGNLNFIICDSKGNILVGGKNGKALTSMNRFLHDHYYVNGEFIKKDKKVNNKNK